MGHRYRFRRRHPSEVDRGASTIATLLVVFTLVMGARGSDAALEAADVALMSDDLTKIPEALRLGCRAARISRTNIAFSILILAVLVPAAVAGILSVAVAVLAHELSELVAVANGVRVGMLRAA
jgi:cation transport ATPase